jgi:hypothetical protein
MPRESESPPHETNDCAVVPRFGLVRAVGFVTEPVCVAQDVVQLLRSGRVKNLLRLADALLAKIDELAERVARRKVVRIGNVDKPFENEPEGFRDLVVIGDTGIQVVPE